MLLILHFRGVAGFLQDGKAVIIAEGSSFKVMPCNHQWPWPILGAWWQHAAPPLVRNIVIFECCDMLVGWREGHPACKNFLLHNCLFPKEEPANSGFLKMAFKWWVSVCVCVCLCVCVWFCTFSFALHIMYVPPLSPSPASMQCYGYHSGTLCCSVFMFQITTA